MDPVLFHIGSVSIYWYSVLLLFAVLVGGFFLTLEAKRMKFDKDYIFNLIFWTILCSLIGARLYYVLFNWEEYSSNLLEIFKTWNGGLAIHGGLIAGFITIVFYTKKYKVKTFKTMDMIAGPLLIGQAIGRWGNLFNGEAHGAATTLAHLRELHIPDFIIDSMNIGGVYYTPTFLYESIWCFLGFILIMFLKRYKYLKIGQLTCIYAMWYGVGRFFIEASRTDSLMFGAFKAAQIISIIMVVIGLLAFMILSRKGKFEDLYNQEEGEIKF